MCVCVSIPLWEGCLITGVDTFTFLFLESYGEGLLNITHKHTYTHKHTHTYIHITHTLTHAHIHTHTHTYTHKHTTHTHTYTHAYTHTRTYTHKHTYIHTNTYTHTHHTHTHTCTHTYTCTHMPCAHTCHMGNSVKSETLALLSHFKVKLKVISTTHSLSGHL